MKKSTKYYLIKRAWRYIKAYYYGNMSSRDLVKFIEEVWQYRQWETVDLTTEEKELKLGLWNILVCFYSKESRSEKEKYLVDYCEMLLQHRKELAVNSIPKTYFSYNTYDLFSKMFKHFDIDINDVKVTKNGWI